MRASILDLRYKTRDVLKAVERREKVEIVYHGKLKAEMIAPNRAKAAKKRVQDHHFFGMTSSEKESVAKTYSCLRKGRLNAI